MGGDGSTSSAAAIRAFGKSLLRRFPALYPAAKWAYIAAKLRADRAIFRRHHPEAEYVRYSRSELEGMRVSGFVSQYGQDYYLWNSVLRHQTSGYFVDIGASDPVQLSNSLFLEKSGWDGSAFDPIPRMAALWRE